MSPVPGDRITRSIRAPQARHPLRAGALALALVVALGGAALLRAETTPPPATAQVIIGWADLVEAVQPAVVNVSTAREMARATPTDPREFFPFGPEGDSPFERFFRRFFDERFGEQRPAPRSPRQERVQGLGSGFIVDPEGHVVTNHHVVDGATRVEVGLVDGRKLDARVIGTDPHTDLALLKVESDEPLPYVRFGDSGLVRVGDPILAVGNPFGLGGTVTSGIVSALGRDIGAGPYDDFLQIDAAINRGNSGGPTFNLQGEVIGVNSAIYSPTGTYVGIGFAIPANLAQEIIRDLRERGTVERGWLGVHIQRVDPDIADSLRLGAPRGALVSQVTPDSPAERGGLRRGDVVLRFNGTEIGEMRELPRAVAQARPGSQAEIVVWRDGAEVTLTLDLGQMPAEQQMAAVGPEASDDIAPQLGLELVQLTPEARRSFSLGERDEGVLVAGVAPDSPAAERGFRPGDLILEVAQEPVRDPAAVARKLREVVEAGNSSVLLLVKRGGQELFVALPLAGA